MYKPSFSTKVTHRYALGPSSHIARALKDVFKNALNIRERPAGKRTECPPRGEGKDQDIFIQWLHMAIGMNELIIHVLHDYIYTKLNNR